MIRIVNVSLKLQFTNIKGIHKVSSFQCWDFQATAFWTRKYVKCLYFKNSFFSFAPNMYILNFLFRIIIMKLAQNADLLTQN